MFRRINVRSRLRIVSHRTTRYAARVFAIRQTGNRPVSLTARIEATTSPAGDAFRGVYDLFTEALIIPNEWLPKRLRNDKTCGNTPARIFASLRNPDIEEESDHARIKAEKEFRVRQYADQVRQGAESPDYDTDGQERLIEYAERCFGRLLKKMEGFDGTGMTDAEFLKKLRD